MENIATIVGVATGIVKAIVVLGLKRCGEGKEGKNMIFCLICFARRFQKNRKTFQEITVSGSSYSASGAGA